VVVALRQEERKKVRERERERETQEIELTVAHVVSTASSRQQHSHPLITFVEKKKRRYIKECCVLSSLLYLNILAFLIGPNFCSINQNNTKRYYSL
jgi:hypothetical protein